MACFKSITISSRSLETIEWCANIMLWMGGVVLAVSPTMAKDSWVVFVLLLAGQVFWACSAFLIRKWTLFASSVFFVVLNLYGIFIRI